MKVVLIPVVLAALVLAVIPVSAHHAWPVSMAKLVTVKGTVKSVTWANPHPMFAVEVRAESGALEVWQVGGPAVNRMEANGWTRTTLKPGDAITGIGYQYADGQKIVRLDRVILPDGKEMRVYARS